MKQAKKAITVFLLWSVLLMGLQISTISTTYSRETKNAYLARSLPQPPGALADHFYKSLLQAIDTAKGCVQFDLQLGNFTTHVGGVQHDVGWRVLPPGLGSPGPFARVCFDYENGALRASSNPDFRPANIEFIPQIQITPRVGFPVTRNVTRIDFDELGSPRRYIDGTTEIDWSGFPNLRSHLEFSHSSDYLHSPANLFLGRPLAGLAPPEQQTGPFRSFILRLTFSNLSVTLKDQSTIYFSKKTVGNNIYDNYATVESPSGFEFKEITYSFPTSQLNGELSRFNLNVQDGQLTTGGVDFRLRKGCSLVFRTIAFSFPEVGGGVAIRGESGFIKGGIGLGSRILFAASPQTLVVSDAGSEITLRDFRMTIGGQSSQFQVGSGSSIKLKVADGRFPIGTSSYVLIRDGVVAIDLTGTWRHNTNPVLRGDIGLLATDVYAGVFRLGGGDSARLKGGTVRSSFLRLDTTQAVPITGKFNSIALDIEDGAQFSVPNRFSVWCRGGARLASDDPIAPLTVSNNSVEVTGNIDAVIPFRRIMTAPIGPNSPYIRNGTLKATLLLRSNGNVEGQDIFLDGQIVYSLREIKDASGLQDKDVIVDIILEDGVMSYQNPTLPASDTNKRTAEATFQAVVHPIGRINLSVPSCPYDDIFKPDPNSFPFASAFRTRFTIYPINLSLFMTEQVKIPPLKLKRVGDDWLGKDAGGNLLKTEGQSAMLLVVPPRGPNQVGDDNRQQLVKVRCFTTGAFGGSTDVTLYPHNYDLPLKITVEFIEVDETPPGQATRKVIKLKLTIRPVLQNLRVDLDECDFDVALATALVVSVVSAFSLIFPPAAWLGIVSGIGVPVALDVLLPRLLDGFIQNKIDEKLVFKKEF